MHIHSKPVDFFTILSVGLWATVLAYTLNSAVDVQPFSSLYWLLLVVGVDVAHVYSSFFRTYLSPSGLKEYKKVLIAIPAICFVGSFIIAYLSVGAFWRTLVYVAVFHFIRQQAGFVRIYQKGKFSVFEFLIYFFTVGSVLLWHLSPNKSFQWFIKNDFYFLPISNSLFFKVIETAMILVMAGFFLFCSYKAFKRRSFQGYQSFTLVLSTFTAWYFGIVVAESDFIFTMTNVLTHGVPYLALVWTTQQKEKTNFSEFYVFAFILLIAAFIEEGFWDALIWREHGEYFSSFYFMESAASNAGVALALALLVLPQLTHYILDGFIWKSKGLKRSWLTKAL